MARYLVTEKTFINGSLQEPGTIIDYDGEAGTALKLVEDEKKAHQAAEKFAPPAQDGPDPVPVPVPDTASGTLTDRGQETDRDREQVEIPEDWESKSKLERIAIARQLGAPEGINADKADDIITAELEKRTAPKD